MKKGVAIGALLFSSVLLGKEENIDVDIRKYHTPMEEKVFELEKGEEREEKIKEAFLMGKKRIEDLKRNEKAVLDLETQKGIDRTKELENLEAKYQKILDDYSTKTSERELILLENKIYEEQLEKLETLKNSGGGQNPKKSDSR